MTTYHPLTMGYLSKFPNLFKSQFAQLLMGTCHRSRVVILETLASKCNMPDTPIHPAIPHQISMF